ncbi:MAG: class I SAM-dependent methyltransferase, partial [Acidimicrobiales bacterium]
MLGGYFVVARLPLDTVAIWEYGTVASSRNIFYLAILGLALFVPFTAIGLAISYLLGSRTESIGRLYAADLAGAALACVIAIPLQVSLGPPRTVMLAAAMLAFVGIMYRSRRPWRWMPGLGVLVLTILPIAVPDLLPQIRTERVKSMTEIDLEYSEWGPVFRVDVQTELFGRHLLYHDGLLGSNILSYDGELSDLTHFEEDPRAIPFQVLGNPPGRALIIGAAGGHEILASLYFGAINVDAVELNPVTTSLLRGPYAEYSGHLVTQPGVSLTTADGRTHLTRSDTAFDLIWFVAPDSYAAGNAASSGAFVLSESYLYTVEMLREALDHLTDRGIIVAQFGEYDFEGRPNRTARYVSTAYAALDESGVDNPNQHLMVSTSSDYPAQLSTIVVKRLPFDDTETGRFTAHADATPGTTVRYTPELRG